MNKPPIRTIAIVLAVALAIGLPIWREIVDFGLTQSEFAREGDETLRAAGVAAVVSGAGPSVLVLERASDGDAGARVLDAVLGPRDGSGRTADGWRVLRPGLDHDGAVGERLPS